MLNKHSDGKTCSLSKKINGFIKNANSSNKAELLKWAVNGTIKEANKKFKKVLYVRTILHTNEEQNLLDFFHPSDFNINGKPVQFLEEFLTSTKNKKPSLIVGTVGQGKSICLRYACFNELCKGETLPIFLELRKLRPSTSIFEQIRGYLNNINFSCSEKLLKYLLNKGVISLYLDGFDEIMHENRQNLMEDIEQISTKYSNVKITVTSRPHTSIYQNISFENHTLQKLNDNDRVAFIKKLITNEDDQIALITKLSTADNGIEELLKSPLMMVLFVSVYRSRRKLPNSYSEFFDELFSTILSRHDGLKVAYDRPTKSGFTDKELKSGLQALSYQSRKENVRQIPEGKLDSLVSRSLNIVDLDAGKSSEFLDDIKSMTCLLQKDDLDYRFIHDSVQEFYSASFVKDQEEAKQDFYEKYLNDWHEWQPELNFLKYIDRVAYTKYFLIPSLESMGNNDSGFSLNKPILIDILKSSNIVLFTDEIGSLHLAGFTMVTQLNNWASNYLCSFDFGNKENEFNESINNFFKNNLLRSIETKELYKAGNFNKVPNKQISIYVANTYKVIHSMQMVDKLYRSFGELELAPIVKEYDSAVNYVARKKRVGGVF